MPHQKSLSALSAEMKDLAARAKTRKLAPHEYQGGSFAISNLGMMGIENFDAVINPPHGSILAVGAGIKTPVVLKDGSDWRGDGDVDDAFGRSPGDRRRLGRRVPEGDRRESGKPDGDAGLIPRRRPKAPAAMRPGALSTVQLFRSRRQSADPW